MTSKLVIKKTTLSTQGILVVTALIIFVLVAIASCNNPDSKLCWYAWVVAFPVSFYMATQPAFSVTSRDTVVAEIVDGVLYFPRSSLIPRRGIAMHSSNIEIDIRNGGHGHIQYIFRTPDNIETKVSLLAKDEPAISDFLRQNFPEAQLTQDSHR